MRATIGVDPYYVRKYAYLKDKGFFGEVLPVEFATTLEKSVIENNIAQVPQVSFETTDHCNLNCRYCSLGDLYTFSKKGTKKTLILKKRCVYCGFFLT